MFFDSRILTSLDYINGWNYIHKINCKWYRHNIDSFVARNLPDGINFCQISHDQTRTGPVVPSLVEESRLVVVQNWNKVRSSFLATVKMQNGFSFKNCLRHWGRFNLKGNVCVDVQCGASSPISKEKWMYFWNSGFSKQIKILSTENQNSP